MTLGLAEITANLGKASLEVLDWVITPEQIQIGETVDEGPASVTYEGLWNDARVIIKVPKIEKELTREEVLFINQEITAITNTNHPNIIPLLGACVLYPDICCVTGFVADGTLESILQDPDFEMSPEDALLFAGQVAKALMYLHELKPGMAHGNLKTSNIFMLPNGSLALSEYGFKKSIFRWDVLNPKTIDNVSWMTPEDLLGSDEDGRMGDVYAYGLVLYAIITRQPLYTITNPMVLGFQKAYRSFIPEIPEFIPQALV